MIQEKIPELPTSDELRDQGIQQAYQKLSLAWEIAFDLMLAEFAKSGEFFTAEHVRQQIGLPPSGPNGLGAAFHMAKRTGRILHQGWQKNTTPSAHSRHVRVYTAVKKGLS